MPETAPFLDAANRWLTGYTNASSHNDTGNTVAAYRRDLTNWARDLIVANGRPDPTLNMRAGDAFRAALRALQVTDFNGDSIGHVLGAHRETYRDATRARMWSTMRRFTAYLVRQNVLPADPIDPDTMRVRTRAQTRIHSFDPAAVNKFLGIAASPPEGMSVAWPARDVALVDVLAFCGPRVSELCGLDFRDVRLDSDPMVLEIENHTKNGFPRTVTLPLHTVTRLRNWFPERARVVNANPNTPLFVQRNGKRFARHQIDYLLRTYAQHAGITIPGDALSHAFRHHFAAEIARRGAPLSVIQQLLGHADPRTTSQYTRLRAGQVTQVLEDIGWLGT